MNKFFTSESVSEGHPDKVSDQISDAILDEYLKKDPNSKVACETLVTTDFVLCAGETRGNGGINIEEVIRKTIKEIGYTEPNIGFSFDTCEIVNKLHEQSDDIYIGVNRTLPELQGAGDQGIMFGYATDESDNYMPLTMEISNLLLKELALIRKEKRLMKYLKPDSKSQVTIEYDDENNPVRIDTIVISTQHDDEVSIDEIKDDIFYHLIPRVKSNLSDNVVKLFDGGYKLLVNPTGKFVTGGPNGDTGLTGRKIIVDTYGGKGGHGGGCFCFSQDTLVKTKKGLKKISEIEIGEEIYTYNEITQKIEIKPVIDVFMKSKKDSYDLLEVEMENGDKIKITENHELMLQDGTWIKARHLKENDEIFDVLGKIIIIFQN